jgi:hypothetical protein
LAWTIQGRRAPAIGHVYGYTLQPQGAGTHVTLYCDWSNVDQSATRIPFPLIPESALRATLGILARTMVLGYVRTEPPTEIGAPERRER